MEENFLVEMLSELCVLDRPPLTNAESAIRLIENIVNDRESFLQN